MKKLNLFACAALMGAAALTAGGPSQVAAAVPAGVSAGACQLTSGAITSSGAVRVQTHVATAPPGITTNRLEPADVFAGRNVRLTSSLNYDGDYENGSGRYGYAVFGTEMYEIKYFTDLQGNVDSRSITKIGGGWGIYRAFESSDLWLGNYHRKTQYGLRSDGVLSRWSVDSKRVWRSTGAVKGYSSFKSWALISQTRTYDTFLANTRGGLLYTIRIPTAAALKPILKVVRSSSWQGFESLQAAKCGKTGAVLLGIDKDSKAGYLYAVGHANGTKTVIRGLGKVRTTFPDAVTFNWAVPTQNDTPPYGE